MATGRIIIATALGAILLVAGLSIVPFVNNVVTADDGSSHHKSSADHGSSSSSSSESRYNVIESACSTGSIITTEGTNRPDQMFGCDLEDIIYGKSGNDVLQGRFANARL
jgi:hypothetical protein